MGTFTVRVPDFEGPLDLLLFFIRRDELDIYNIPIAHITREFLDALHLMQMLDLELASEFIVMAATLMQIKARMLIPHTDEPGGEDEEGDPRAELTRRLLEYRRFKETAGSLERMERDQRDRSFRAYFAEDTRAPDPERDGEALADVTLFHLIAAFRHALRNVPETPFHEIRTIPYSIEEQGLAIMNFFGARPRYTFLELAETLRDKIHFVVTFIALLELVRARRVRIEITGEFNNFSVIRDGHTPADSPRGTARTVPHQPS
jgi:segregation and condensation protein A